MLEARDLLDTRSKHAAPRGRGWVSLAENAGAPSRASRGSGPSSSPAPAQAALSEGKGATSTMEIVVFDPAGPLQGSRGPLGLHGSCSEDHRSRG